MKNMSFKINGNINVVYILFIVMVAFILLLVYVFIGTSDHFDYPPGYLNLHIGKKNCASAGCNRYDSYDFYGSVDEIIHFYNNNGYKCVDVVKDSSDNDIFPRIDKPYKQCISNLNSSEFRSIGFSVENVGVIKVSMWSYWEEW